MINVYQDMLANPGYFKQLVIKDGLLVNYQCPQMTEWVDLFSHLNHIIYTVNGKKILKSPSKTYILSEGKLVFLKKGAIHQGKFYDVDWRTIVFCISDNYLQQLYNEYRPQLANNASHPAITDSVIELNTTDFTQPYFNSLLPYFTQTPPPPETLLELKCRELIFSVFSNPENDAFTNYIKSISDCNKPPLAEIMEANFLYNLSLEEFAKISQRSLTTFKNEFVTRFKTSPGKWLLQKRLDYAKLLLFVSEKNINEIVFESGFESATHFSRTFKEKFGVSPLQYRKNNII